LLAATHLACLLERATFRLQWYGVAQT